jgi:hypothetical protein
MVVYSNRSNGNNQQRNMNDRIRCEVLEEIGVIGQKKDGWTREVNIVSWNNAPAKVDVRDWDPDHNRMSKGITLLEEEAENLVKVLAARYGIRLTNNTPVFTQPQEEETPAETAGELYQTADAAEELPDEPFTDGSDT